MKKLMQGIQDNFTVQLFPDRFYEKEKRYFLQERNDSLYWWYEIYDAETGDSIFAGTDCTAACKLADEMNKNRIK